MGRHAVLSFGLVNVPVSIETAAQRKEVSFKTLHGETTTQVGDVISAYTCLTPVKQFYRCPEHPDAIVNGNTVKGYEYAKGQYLVLSKEEIEKAGTTRSSIIEITKFVDKEDVDPIYLDKTYWLDQDDMLKESYVLLMRALGDLNVVGIGKTSAWGKEYPCMIWTDGIRLYLGLLFCREDIRPMGVPETPENLQNLGLARELVAAMKRELEPEDLHSDSRQRLENLIAAKLSGAEIETPVEEPEPEITLDIQANLRASLELARSQA